MGFNLGFAAGGAAEGLNQGFGTARQAAVEQAYIKLRQQQQDMMKRQLDYKAAENMAAHPETAEAMGNVYPEIDRYHSDPGNYSWTQPPTPVQGPPTPEDAALGQFNLPPQEHAAVPGQQGYQSMLGYWGQKAREAAIEAEGRKYEHMVNLWSMKPTVNPELARILAAARAAGGVEGTASVLPQVGDIAEAKAGGAAKGSLPYAGAKAAAAAAGAGKVVPTGGTISIPSPGGSVQVPEVNRMPNPAQVREMGDLTAAIDFVDSLAKAAGAGGPGTGTGKLESAWTQSVGKYTGVPVLGELIRSVDPHIANRAAFHEALGQNLLTTLRTTFKGRISNFDILIGKEVIPNAEDGDDVRNAKLNELSARLHAAKAALDQANQAGGIAAMQPVAVRIPPEGFLGKIGPAGGMMLPQPPAPTNGQFQIPNLGVSPVPPPPQRFNTLRPEQ